MGVSARARLAAMLEDREPGRIRDAPVDRRAAVALVLRTPGTAAPLPREADPAPGDDPLHPEFGRLEALFVRRAERDGDPWSGHVGLPGGHREPGDADLRAAARREVEEETGLVLPPGALLGRLDEVHPRSRRLPSVAVTPFVAWLADREPVRPGVEVADHFWAPLGELGASARRSVLTLRRGDAYRVFPTIEYGGRTIWGLTFTIVERFLGLLPRGTGDGEWTPPPRRTTWRTR